MKFGPVPPRDAAGATAVHTIRQGSLVLKKGTWPGPSAVAVDTSTASRKDIEVGDFIGANLTVEFTTPVPEPATYAMLLAGLGLLWFEARRRKKLQSATDYA